VAKKKVRPHPGVLKQLLKDKNMTQAEAAAAPGGIDRKTQAKIDRGEEVKLETLQKLADKLKVPITYFDPPAGPHLFPSQNSWAATFSARSVAIKAAPLLADWVQSQRSRVEDPGWLSLLLPKLNADDLYEMLLWVESEKVEWKLNVHTIDDETILLLEQFEDAVNDVRDYINTPPDSSLREELAKLKKTRHVASLMEELAKHGLALFGASYLSWECDKGAETYATDSGEFARPYWHYKSHNHCLLSIDGHLAPERRQKVWQGTMPPRFAPEGTLVTVNGGYVNTEAEQKILLNTDASSGDSNAK
jgi:transcriptional regulator with XRE-family HTH domain